MKLGKRQNDMVNQLIKEEVQNILAVQRGGAQMNHRSIRNDRLVERGPDAMRVDLSIVEKTIEDLVYEETADSAQGIVYDFHAKVLKIVCDVMNKHAMSAIEMVPKELDSELQDYDDDSLMDASQECAMDITNAFVKYAKEVAKLSVDLAGGNDAEYSELHSDEEL